MKKINVVIAAVILLLCLGGWLSMLTQTVSDINIYDQYIEDADSWAERGLYQRAIENYKLALAQKPTQELYEKAAQAYRLRYKEAPEDTYEGYVEFLESATAAHPAHAPFVDALVSLYLLEENSEGIYSCLSRAIAGGYDTQEVKSLLLDAKYSYTLRRSEFSGLQQSVGELYSAARNGRWNLYSTESGYILSSEYDYVGPCSEDGIVVVTGEDSRILKSDGMVLGIFKKPVTDAGIFAEGLLPACCGGSYAYYNDFAEKQFGNYEAAGMFQNGAAAVKENGKWMLVDAAGEPVSDTYDQIVLDAYGRYLVNDTILVKTGKSSYALYDKKWKLISELSCSEIDVRMTDELIAVCENGKWGYMNTSGEMLIKPTYSDARSFANGLAAVYKDGLWGFIDAENNLVIDYQFSQVGYMNGEGLCPVRTDMPDENAVSGEDTAPDEKETFEKWKLLELTLGIIAGK